MDEEPEKRTIMDTEGRGAREKSLHWIPRFTKGAERKALYGYRGLLRDQREEHYLDTEGG